jgi:hypothetical protein
LGNVNPVAVILTELVTSVATETGFADASFDNGRVPPEFSAATL